MGGQKAVNDAKFPGKKNFLKEPKDWEIWIHVDTLHCRSLGQ